MRGSTIAATVAIPLLAAQVSSIRAGSGDVERQYLADQQPAEDGDAERLAQFRAGAALLWGRLNADAA